MTNAEKFKEVFGFEVEDAYEDFWVEDFRMTKEQVIEYFEEQLGIFGIDCDHGIAMISAIELLRGEAEPKHGKEQEPKAKQFAKWVATEIFDDMWEYNKDAFAEIACRKLAKLGIVRAKGNEWELVEPQESEDRNDKRRSDRSVDK